MSNNTAGNYPGKCCICGTTACVLVNGTNWYCGAHDPTIDWPEPGSNVCGKRGGCTTDGCHDAELSSLRARLAEARAALAPFAKHADRWSPDVYRDAHEITLIAYTNGGVNSVTVGDFRRAARVLSAPSSPSPVLPPDAEERVAKALAWAHPAACSMLCPSTGVAGVPIPHLPECVEARRVLALRGEVRP